MKIRDMFTREFAEKYGDADVCCGDNMFMALCGPILLTEEGEKYYGEILDNAIDTVHYPDGYTVVYIQDCQGYAEFRKMQSLFSSAAGYCSEENYNKWFILEE